MSVENENGNRPAGGGRPLRLAGTRMPDGKPVASRDAPLGGQAVLEGVMMRGVSHWAVAVREPAERGSGITVTTGNGASLNGAVPELDADGEPLVSWTKKHRAYRLPIIRGVVALAESLVIGFRALGIAANAQVPDEEEPISGGLWIGTIVVALAFAIGLFFVVPVGLTSLIKDAIGSAFLFWLIEGLVRTAIFLGYLLLLSRLKDLRRVFEYHGAEHKTIAAYEGGVELTPENAAKFSRLHPRCGTSFLLIVMIVAIFVFAPIGLPAWWLLVLTRILGVPLIAGISFEIIKWAGRNRNKAWVRTIMWPGLQLQKLTTREPDAAELAVAIAALDAVLEVEKPGEADPDELIGIEVVA